MNRFFREIRVASSLANPHCVTLYDFGQTAAHAIVAPTTPLAPLIDRSTLFDSQHATPSPGLQTGAHIPTHYPTPYPASYGSLHGSAYPNEHDTRMPIIWGIVLGVVALIVCLGMFAALFFWITNDSPDILFEPNITLHVPDSQ